MEVLKQKRVIGRLHKVFGRVASGSDSAYTTRIMGGDSIIPGLGEFSKPKGDQFDALDAFAFSDFWRQTVMWLMCTMLGK